MNLITTMYNDELLDLDKLPSSKKIEYVFVGQDILPVNDFSLFGEKIYVIHIYGKQDLKKLPNMLRKLNPFILAVDPLYFSFTVRFMQENGLIFNVSAITEQGVISWMLKFFPGSIAVRCRDIAKLFSFKLWNIYHSRDVVHKYLNGLIKLTDVRVERSFTFTDMLLFLVGDTTLDRLEYTRAVIKYRYAVKRFVAVSQRSLKNYIDSILESQEPDKLSIKLANFITIEQAMLLHEELSTITVPQLLRN